MYHNVTYLFCVTHCALFLLIWQNNFEVKSSQLYSDLDTFWKYSIP